VMMEMWYPIYLLVVIILFFNACGKNLEDPDPPARPEWMPKSLPYDTTETGIDAIPESDYIVLEWYTGNEDDLNTYRIYRTSRKIENKYDLLEEVPSDLMAGSINTYLDESVSIGTSYFYFLRAVDQAGNLSPRSDTIEYKLVTKVNLREPVNVTITDVKPTFKWSDVGTAASEYVIRVEQLNPIQVIWLSALSRRGYTDEIQSIKYGTENTFYLTQEELSRGVNYRWRIDAVATFNREGDEVAGSESNWGYFRIQ